MAQKETHTIDATGKTLGRLATEVAVLLRGKHRVFFEKHVLPEVTVEITNTSHLIIDSRKKESKIYKRYSGYPGGLKSETMREIISKKGYGEVLRRAVYGMLPGNRLRNRIMKNLIIKE